MNQTLLKWNAGGMHTSNFNILYTRYFNLRKYQTYNTKYLDF